MVAWHPFDVGVLTMFWFYHLPTWQMGTLVISVYCAVAYMGSWLVDQYLKPHQSNNLVSDTIRSVVACYSILMGLTAVTTWNNFKDVQSTVAREAYASAEVYQACAIYHEPERSRLQSLLRTYVRIVIHEEWPAQQEGQLVEGATAVLQRLKSEHHLVRIDTKAEAFAHDVAKEKLGELSENRRLRRLAITGGLHPMMWFVAVFGSILSVSLACFYATEHKRLKHCLTAALAGMVGLMIFWVLALDRPLLGDVSVQPDRFQYVLHDVMTESPARTAVVRP